MTTKKVNFGSVEIRDYVMTLGDNPSVSIGPPVCLGEVYHARETVPVEEYEKSRAGKRRRPQSLQLKLNYYQRYDILHEAGFDDKRIQAAERGVSLAKWKRKASYYYCYPYVYAGKVKTQRGQRRNKRYLRKTRRGG